MVNKIKTARKTVRKTNKLWILLVIGIFVIVSSFSVSALMDWCQNAELGCGSGNVYDPEMWEPFYCGEGENCCVTSQDWCSGDVVMQCCAGGCISKGWDPNDPPTNCHPGVDPSEPPIYGVRDKRECTECGSGIDQICGDYRCEIDQRCCEGSCKEGTKCCDLDVPRDFIYESGAQCDDNSDGIKEKCWTCWKNKDCNDPDQDLKPYDDCKTCDRGDGVKQCKFCDSDFDGTLDACKNCEYTTIPPPSGLSLTGLNILCCYCKPKDFDLFTRGIFIGLNQGCGDPQSIPDVCATSNILVERECFNGKLENSYYRCSERRDGNIYCKGGACVKGTTPVEILKSLSVYEARYINQKMGEGYVYQFGPSGYVFNKNISLTMKYNGELFDEQDDIAVFRYSDAEIQRDCSYDVLSETSQTIDSGGGIVELEDARLDFPAGAVSEPVTITIKKLDLTCSPIIPQTYSEYILLQIDYYKQGYISYEDLMLTIDSWKNY